MWNHRFDPQGDAPRLRLPGRIERARARSMHDINVRADRLRKGGQMMHPFGFDVGRPRGLMPLGPRLPFGEQLLLPPGHELRILTMGRHDHAQSPGQVERLIELTVVDAKRALDRPERL